jgi:nicotinate-nucleotide adenylyltransferase
MAVSRIGILGGAFDPPHLAHRALAQAALSQLGLTELRVLPTGQAWHKARMLSDAAHRLAMARLNFDLPGVVVDDREIRRSGPSYTIDTVNEIQAEHPGAEVCVLMGLDQAQALPTWKEWERLVAQAIICVADRADDTKPHSVLDSANSTQLCFPHLPPERWRHVIMPLMPVSATLIRQRLADQRPLDGLVSPAVASYIDQHHLYTPA